MHDQPPTTPTPPAADHGPRVAVLVVHGVGNQTADHSARAIGGHLLNLQRRPGHARYTPFAEERLHILTTPVEVIHDCADEHCAYFRRQVAPQPGPARPLPAYDTLRLTGQRLDQRGQAAAAVDIHECFWADQSRLATGMLGPLNLVSELYRIIFHLPHLGREVLAHCGIAGPWRHVWHVGAAFQWVATMALTVALPLLNLMLLALLAIPLAIWLADDHPLAATAVAAGLQGLPVAIGGLFLAFRAGSGARPTLVASAAIAGLALGGATAQQTWLLLRDDHWLSTWLAIQALVLAAIGTGLLTWRYARSQPPCDLRRPSHPLAQRALRSSVGPLLAMWAVLVLGTCAHLGWETLREDGRPLLSASIGTAIVLFELLNLCWGVLLLAFGWALLLLALTCICRRMDSEEPDRRRAWTACIGLVVPIPVFLVLTVGGWLLIMGLMTGYGLIHDTQVVDALKTLMVRCIPPSQAAMWLGMAIALAAAGLAPLALAEVRVPGGGDAESRRYGRWLDLAFRFLAMGGWLLCVGLMTYFIMALLWPGPTHDSMQLDAVLGLIGVAGVAVLVRATPITGVLGSVVDVMLDVDNHLRTDPQGDNPRARIAARMSSVLRYLDRWRDDQGRAYAGIVIVAHSQGTIITCDVLRLARHGGIRLWRGDPPPVRLFTMGSPLRQLYGRRFPASYGWGYGRSAVGQPLRDTPEPDQLAVREWVNAYRSGDYVGRALWTADGDPRRFACAAQGEDAWQATAEHGRAQPEAPRSESCIGPGAHVHYWDDTAPRIAREIDRLILDSIAEAAAAAARPPQDPPAAATATATASAAGA